MDNDTSGQATPGRMMRIMQWMMPKLTPGHAWLYRKLNGRIVNRLTAGAPVVLLTTRGRRSGLPRTVAVGHLCDDEGHVIVAGTNGGLPPFPGWIHNVRAHPEVELQVGSDCYRARAEFLQGAEWQHHWERLVKAFPTYADAQRWAGRRVPLVRMRRVDQKSPSIT